MKTSTDKKLSAREELLRYIESLTPEQLEKIFINLPRLIGELEKLGQPVPPLDFLNNS